MRYIAGYGIKNRFDHLHSWAQQRFDEPIIYSFWKGKRCLYVGKGKSYRRLNAYKHSHYLMAANCIEVWPVMSENKLPSSECLAVHLFKPSDNENKPAKVKWGKRCPICRRHDNVKEELDSLLRLKA